MKIVVAWVVTSMACRAVAAPFQNLDFEQVNTNAVVPISQVSSLYLEGAGPARELLPGWTLTRNGVNQDFVIFNVIPIGSSYFGIATKEGVGMFTSYFPRSAFPEGLSGNYGIYAVVPEPVDWMLTQRGDIPVNAKFLSLDAWIPIGMSIEPRINGILLINGDVSPYAGQTVDLSLRLYQSGPIFSSFGTSIGLDRIQFVPEPSTWALAGLGGTLFCACAWWRRSRVVPGGRRS